ncbi:SDR family NAD(P)-dependent oxidoreductase [Aquabacterium sp.]|uniref:SDR family NAD(P)-dependent oxidoreductase n=1 Tax=Aquabacterium sp. TaxID=1872578 RepID=UPI002CB4BAA7|nr:SDR family oxidoreductase [Aquabacterium sp.]HSW07323.1 SDR family oxidoreductase [Aquabacterium sp.]
MNLAIDTARLRLQNKVALVCGAASGIGEAVVQRFVQEGARVVAAGWPQPAGDAALRCDVTDDAQVRSLVATALQRHGRIDVLVNAAGVIAADDAGTIDDALWSRQHEVNLAGTMRTMRAVLPHMLARGSGAIVNIASVAAFNAGAGSASYAASKAGVVALTRSAAMAYGGQGVRVNALCPGWVATPMAEREMQELALALGISEQEAHQRTVARIALQRMARPDEMAAVCLFLACDESSFVTGAALVADGGTRVPAAMRAI